MTPPGEELSSGSPPPSQQTNGGHGGARDGLVGFADSGDGGSAIRTNTVPGDAVDVAQAYRDLLRGEQTATALETNLTALERKLDELLASFEANNGAAAKTRASGGGAPEMSDRKRDVTG